jgi:hypothetical protein
MIAAVRNLEELGGMTRRRALADQFLRSPVLMAIAVIVLLVSPASAGRAASQAAFKTPDGNVNCVVDVLDGAARAQCWVLSANCFNREIGQTVAYAWALPPSRGAVPVRFCPGDFVPGRFVLRYGHRIRRGKIICKSSRIGLRCDRGRHGFLLSRTQQRTW